MNTYNIYFCGEIRKNINTFELKKSILLRATINMIIFSAQWTSVFFGINRVTIPLKPESFILGNLGENYRYIIIGNLHHLIHVSEDWLGSMVVFGDNSGIIFFLTSKKNEWEKRHDSKGSGRPAHLCSLAKTYALHLLKWRNFSQRIKLGHANR